MNNKKQNVYKGLLEFEDEFDHKYACWAFNHNGWSKMKKANKKKAKKKDKQMLKKEIEKQILEYEQNLENISPIQS